MGAVTKRQVAALTLCYAIVRGVIEKVKAESPAEESNLDNVTFNSVIATAKDACASVQK